MWKNAVHLQKGKNAFFYDNVFKKWTVYKQNVIIKRNFLSCHFI